MKYLFLLIVFLYSSFDSFSQCDSVRVSIGVTNHEGDISHTQSITHYTPAGNLLSYSYSSEAYPSGILYESHTESYQYDANDSLIYQNSEYLDQDGNIYYGVEYLYSFDSAGHRISFLKRSWYNGAWQTDQQDSMSYNSSGLLTCLIHYINNLPSIDITYFYNNNNLVDTELIMTWNGSSWDSTSQLLNYYNSNSVPDSQLTLLYNNGWMNSGRKFYLYNTHLTLPDTVYTQVFNGAWTNDSMTLYSYGPLDKIILTTYLYWNGSAWIYEHRDVTDIDANGYPTIFDEQYAYYDPTDSTVSWSTWTGAQYYTYDADGHLISYHGHPIPGGPYYGNYTYINGILVSGFSHSETMGGITTETNTDFYYTLITGDSVICNGSNTILITDSCPGYQYIWQNGQQGDSIVVGSPGVYQVHVIYPNGYVSYSQPLTVDVVIAIPYIPAGADSSINVCANRALALFSPDQQNTLYQWYRDTVAISYTSASATIYGSELVNGSYYLIATNICGSDTSARTTINVLPFPVAAITASGPTALCPGDSVTLISDNAASYTWSNGASTQSITVGTNGNYNVIVSNTSGCTATAYKQVTRLTTIGPFTIYATSGTLTSNTNSTNRQWFFNGDTIPGANLLTYVPTQAGYYMMALSGVTGCATYSDSIYFDPTILSVDAGQNKTICSNGTTTIGFYNAASGGTPSYSYQWSPASLVLNPFASQTQTVSLNTDQLFYQTVTDAMGTVATDSMYVYIAQLNGPALINNFSGSFCAEDYSTITLSAPGSQVLAWYMNGDSVYGPNHTFQLNYSGIYQVKFRDQYGCIVTSQPDTVSQFPLTTNPVLNIIPDSALCVTGMATVFIHPLPGQTYQWRRYPQSIIISTDTIITSVLPFTYRLDITDSNGCSTQQYLDFNSFNETFSFPIVSNDADQCNGYSTLLAPEISGWSYQWFRNGNILVNDTGNSLIATVPDQYTCVITGPAGCTGSATYYVQNNVSLNVSIQLQGTQLISNQPSYYIHKWYLDGNPLPNSNLTVFSPSAAGNYYVIITDQNGCTAISNIIFYPACSVSIQTNSTVLCDSVCTATITANATGIAPIHYLWSTNDTTFQVNNLCAGNYTVTVIDSNGCTASNYITISEDSIIVSAIQINPNCSGCSNGQIILNIQSTYPNQYTITPATGIISGDTILNLPAGIYSICVTDSLNCTSCISDTLFDEPLIVNDDKAFEKPVLFPNPVRNELLFSRIPQQIKIFRLLLRNVEGSAVKTFFTMNKIYPISDLISGIYFAELEMDGKYYYYRFIKM
jgi:hypothetical protein